MIWIVSSFLIFRDISYIKLLLCVLQLVGDKTLVVSEPGGDEVKTTDNTEPLKEDPSTDNISETSSQVSTETPPLHPPQPTTETTTETTETIENRKKSTSSSDKVERSESASVEAESTNESIDENNISNTHTTLDSTDADSGIEVKAVLEKTEDDEDFPATTTAEDSGEQSGEQSNSSSNMDSTGEPRDFSSDETITNVPVGTSNLGVDHPDIDPFNNSSESQSNESSFADFASFETPAPQVDNVDGILIIIVICVWLFFLRLEIGRNFGW